VRHNPDHQIVDVRPLLPTAHYEVVYATERNFLGRQVYPEPELFLRRPAALGLVRAAERLSAQGCGLRLFDGYRPYAVTVLFYEELQDPNFAADPRKGSKHNRGMAIDLALYDLRTGHPLPMPSAYDEISERASHAYEGGDAQARHHRDLLRETMRQAGFSALRHEWWHYDFAGWERCPIYDLSHREIREANAGRGGP
jgi:D-alanyl-D-alanine dipeptidase